MVANGGGAHVRGKTSDTTWGGWGQLAGGRFRTITALNYDGVMHAAMIDTAGELWRSQNSGGGWTAATQLARPGGVAAFADADMTWDEGARGFMLAVATNQGNALHFLPMYGGGAFRDWHHCDTRL